MQDQTKGLNEMKTVNVFLMVVLGFGAVGCLQSPLLNHANADQVRSERNGFTATAPCALELAKESLCVSVEWLKAPTAEEQGEFILRFWSKDQGSEKGPFVDPAETTGLSVGVKLWMPEMGHGSSPVQVVEQAPGVYAVQNVFFVMSGDWQVFIQLKKDRQVIDQAQFDYQF
jgi:hypothetical protein